MGAGYPEAEVEEEVLINVVVVGEDADDDGVFDAGRVVVGEDVADDGGFDVDRVVVLVVEVATGLEDRRTVVLDDDGLSVIVVNITVEDD